jgi:hypothetical protein
MTASAKSTHNHSWVSRLILSLTIGLMTFALGAATAFAGTGAQAPHFAGNVAGVISADGGDQVTLNEDDECDDDDCEESGGSGGGGLPATDTAPLVTSDAGNTPIPAMAAFALLVIAGLAGGSVMVAAKRSI